MDTSGMTTDEQTTTDTPQRRRRRLLLPLLAFGAVIILAAAGTVLAVQLRGSADSGPSPDDAATPVTVNIILTTSSYIVGQNHDDYWCIFRELEYEVRDAAGVIVAADKRQSPDVTAGTARWAALGRVASGDTYECVLGWGVQVEPSDFYQITVWSVGAFGSSHTVSETFGREDVNAVRVNMD